MDRPTLLNEGPENSYGYAAPFDSDGEQWLSNDCTASPASKYHKRYCPAAFTLTEGPVFLQRRTQYVGESWMSRRYLLMNATDLIAANLDRG
jgi:hypothetical protein